MQQKAILRSGSSARSIRKDPTEPLSKSNNRKAAWECVLELSKDRTINSGNNSALCAAIQRGADLRVGTSFRHNEHVDVNSSCNELIQEFVDFRITYLLEDRWIAGVCNLRMPVEIPNGFGPRESMSFFLYNQDAQQAIARPHLDGKLPGKAPISDNCDQDYQGRYKTLSKADLDTNAPSSNFIYNFDFYRYCVNDRWTEVLSHDANGITLSGSISDLAAAFNSGAEIKVAINSLCADLYDKSDHVLNHEVFVHIGSTYYYTDQKLFMGATHPVVRVKPAIPLVYQSHRWDFGWLLPRTDGYVARWLCNPYNLKFQKSTTRHSMRWFVNF